MVVPPDVDVDVDERVSDPMVVASVEVVAVDGFVESTRHMKIKIWPGKKKIVFCNQSFKKPSQIG